MERSDSGGDPGLGPGNGSDPRSQAWCACGLWWAAIQVYIIQLYKYSHKVGRGNFGLSKVFLEERAIDKV